MAVPKAKAAVQYSGHRRQVGHPPGRANRIARGVYPRTSTPASSMTIGIFRRPASAYSFNPMTRWKTISSEIISPSNEHGPGAELIAANPAVSAAGASILNYLAAQQAARGVRSTALDTPELDQGIFFNLINKTSIKLNDDHQVIRNILGYSGQRIRRDDDEDGTTLVLLDSLGPGRRGPGRSIRRRRPRRPATARRCRVGCTQLADRRLLRKRQQPRSGQAILYPASGAAAVLLQHHRHQFRRNDDRALWTGHPTSSMRCSKASKFHRGIPPYLGPLARRLQPRP